MQLLIVSLIVSISGKVVMPLYGDLDEYAYYFTDIYLGHPLQRSSAIIDTGSTIGAIPCSICTHCGRHIDPIFDIKRSDNFKYSNHCGNTGSDKCVYQQNYREGGGIKGVMIEDTFRLGNSTEFQAAFGCHETETKLFYDQKASGILGLFPHKPGQPESLLEHLWKSEKRKAFSLCLSEKGGEMQIGNLLDSSFLTSPMVMGKFYTVFPQKLKIGEESINGKFGDAILDSGTTLTYFPSEIFKLIKRNIYAAHKPDHSDCWDIVDDLPEITIEFRGNIQFKWVAKNGYLYWKSKVNKWCMAFADSYNSETVFGASFMINKQIIFDVDAKVFAFKYSSCPIVRDRPAYENASNNSPQPPSQPSENAAQQQPQPQPDTPQPSSPSETQNGSQSGSASADTPSSNNLILFDGAIRFLSVFVVVVTVLSVFLFLVERRNGSMTSEQITEDHVELEIVNKLPTVE
jgi:Eukaryotic aspartyl protease